MSKTVDLFTKEGKELKGIPWDVYPRPLLKRDSFVNLKQRRKTVFRNISAYSNRGKPIFLKELFNPKKLF